MKKTFLIGIALIAMFFSVRAQNVSISGNQFTVNGKQIWFNGINVPWDNWDDFGGTFVPSWWNTEFQNYVDNKINLARVWIHCEGRVSPTTNADGSVTGASAQFWSNMDSLIAISRAKKVYIMPCLWSFDMVKNTNSATYQQYRNLINSQANIQTYIDNFIIPLVKRYNSEPYILAWEICNEPEWMFENAEDGPIPVANVQRLHAMVAAAIHKNSTKYVTTGSACVKWNSYLYQNSGDNAGNVWGDTTLQRIYNDPQAKLDFWQIHWYAWMEQWFQSPYTNTTVGFKIDDKPVLVGETEGNDICDTYVCQTLTQMYESAYVNGFDGVCGWKTPQNDGHGTFANISAATKVFYGNHPGLIYPSGAVIPVTGVTVTPATVSINTGSTAQLTATVAPTNATNKTVSWTSSNPAIASVSTTGLLTGIACGVTTITVTTQDGSKTATIVVTIICVPVIGVTVAPTTATIAATATTQLTATLAPLNAANKNVSWISSNTTVATVSSTGLVTGIVAGSATITVTTLDGSKTATCAVIVTGNIIVTGVTVAPKTATVDQGSAIQLTATVSPTNAVNKSVTWSSSNTAVATVSSTGLVAGVGGGTANITVTTVDGAKTDVCAVVVNSIQTLVTGVTVTPTTATINVGVTSQLTATVAPVNATNKSVTWSSSNTAIATVSSTGLVAGVAIGSATITVKTVDQSKTATSVITVSISGMPCANPVAITIPYKFDGAGEYCWSTTQAIAYVNSWNMTLVEINGVDYTNKWSSSMPAAINGTWYIHYKGSYAWSHFEAPATKSASETENAVSNLFVYPNPVKDHVNIVIPDAKGSKSVLKVFDNAGRLMKSIEMDGERYILDVTGFTSGMYNIVVYSNGKVLRNSIIKE